MSIHHYDTEDELDDAFEAAMDAMQEEQRLKDAICEAEERVAEARDELQGAEDELLDLRKQLEALGA
jgi:predicted  nucleic acid-binding Zn-ribbon protein